MFCDSHKPGLLSWELYLAAVPSSSLSHLCLTEVVLFSISLPRTYNCSFYFCYSLLSSINSCSLRIFWVPPEMSTLVWHCPFLWEMWSILLCYGCDYRSWIHTWTPFLTCITPRKFESDFHFKFTFVFPFQTVSWFLCSFVLNMFQFIISLAWVLAGLAERPAEGVACGCVSVHSVLVFLQMPPVREQTRHENRPLPLTLWTLGATMSVCISLEDQPQMRLPLSAFASPSQQGLTVHFLLADFGLWQGNMPYSLHGALEME